MPCKSHEDHRAPPHHPERPHATDVAPRPCAHRRTGGAVAGSPPREGACKPRSMVGALAAPRGAEGSEADPAQGRDPKRRKRRERRLENKGKAWYLEGESMKPCRVITPKGKRQPKSLLP